MGEPGRELEFFPTGARARVSWVEGSPEELSSCGEKGGERGERG